MHSRCSRALHSQLTPLRSLLFCSSLADRWHAAHSSTIAPANGAAEESLHHHRPSSSARMHTNVRRSSPREEHCCTPVTVAAPDACSLHLFVLLAFSSDHNVGLCAGWSLGVIYCSEVTRALLLLEHGPTLTKRLRTLTIDQTHLIAMGAADAVQGANGGCSNSGSQAEGN